jgi:hypothetical protein
LTFWFVDRASQQGDIYFAHCSVVR